MLQYERAAEIYRKMKRPMASSRCYELLGQFNRALIVLYENEYFDMAIDTLKRYRMLMEVCCRKKPWYGGYFIIIRNNIPYFCIKKPD